MTERPDGPQARPGQRPQFIRSSGLFYTCPPDGTPEAMNRVLGLEVDTSDLVGYTDALEEGRPDASPPAVYLNRLRLLIDLAAVDLEQFSTDVLKRDLQILSKIAADDSAKLTDFMSALDDPARAAQLARTLGLTEDAFCEQGGGFLILLIFVAAAATVLVSGCASAPAPDIPRVDIGCGDTHVKAISGTTGAAGESRTRGGAWFKARLNAGENVSWAASHKLDGFRCNDPVCPVLEVFDVKIDEPDPATITYVEKQGVDWWGNPDGTTEYVCRLKRSWTAKVRCVGRK